MTEEKRSTAITALKVGTGYHAISRVVSDVKGSIGRFKSLLGLIDPKSEKAIRPKGVRHMVFSPYLYQYGEKTMVDGREVFVPEGVVDTPDNVPEGKTVLKGAYFCGDDFSALIDDVFTEAQQVEMIRGAEIKKLIMLTGAIASLVVVAMFVATGRLFALSSLPVVALLLVYALKYGIYVETLRTKKIIGFRHYFKRHGLIGWMFA